MAADHALESSATSKLRVQDDSSVTMSTHPKDTNPKCSSCQQLMSKALFIDIVPPHRPCDRCVVCSLDQRMKTFRQDRDDAESITLPLECQRQRWDFLHKECESVEAHLRSIPAIIPDSFSKRHEAILRFASQSIASMTKGTQEVTQEPSTNFETTAEAFQGPKELYNSRSNEICTVSVNNDKLDHLSERGCIATEEGAETDQELSLSDSEYIPPTKPRVRIRYSMENPKRTRTTRNRKVRNNERDIVRIPQPGENTCKMCEYDKLLSYFELQLNGDPHQFCIECRVIRRVLNKFAMYPPKNQKEVRDEVAMHIDEWVAHVNENCEHSVEDFIVDDVKNDVVHKIWKRCLQAPRADVGDSDLAARDESVTSPERNLADGPLHRPSLASSRKNLQGSTLYISSEQPEPKGSPISHYEHNAEATYLSSRMARARTLSLDAEQNNEVLSVPGAEGNPLHLCSSDTDESSSVFKMLGGEYNISVDTDDDGLTDADNEDEDDTINDIPKRQHTLGNPGSGSVCIPDRDADPPTGDEITLPDFTSDEEREEAATASSVEYELSSQSSSGQSHTRLASLNNELIRFNSSLGTLQLLLDQADASPSTKLAAFNFLRGLNEKLGPGLRDLQVFINTVRMSSRQMEQVSGFWNA